MAGGDHAHAARAEIVLTVAGELWAPPCRSNWLQPPSITRLSFSAKDSSTAFFSHWLTTHSPFCFLRHPHLAAVQPGDCLVNGVLECLLRRCPTVDAAALVRKPR